jgi:hypothetical protein
MKKKAKIHSNAIVEPNDEGTFIAIVEPNDEGTFIAHTNNEHFAVLTFGENKTLAYDNFIIGLDMAVIIKSLESIRGALSKSMDESLNVSNTANTLKNKLCSH